MLASVLDVLFPRKCVGCGRGTWPFCPACRSGLIRLGPPGCARCGRSLEAPVPACRDCPPPPLTWARSGLLYQGAARAALLRLKFGSIRTVAPAMVPWLVDALVRAPPPGWEPLFDPLRVARMGPAEPPSVTWVPLGRRRRRGRGFDQAEALARAVSGAIGWPLSRLLGRTHETAPQARRTGPARREALRGAFRPLRPSPGRVVLVDDVLTSGSTGAACAAALVEGGAREVLLLTAARSLGGPIPARCYDPRGLQTGSVVARGTFLR